MPVVSKPAPARKRKRLAAVMIAASVCPLIGACGNDDQPTGTTTANPSSSNSPADNPSAQMSAQDNPLAASPVPAAVTILSPALPALPASGADAALSAAASTPLATPIIHTAD
ncbi:hypothetical protein LMG28140_03184 [Paraburkholderia metrosideri]|uniref:Lipoprotein n=2 Tax=Paraburkholderia metrosideri TaxID=580937 RepID=A0ABM8NQ21_9BURK|nr:hypothetical protein LMG28140_03184 [Paraburkholderia metrosideri]